MALKGASAMGGRYLRVLAYGALALLVSLTACQAVFAAPAANGAPARIYPR